MALALPTTQGLSAEAESVPDCHRKTSSKAAKSDVEVAAEGCCDSGTQCSCASLCQSASLFETSQLKSIAYYSLKTYVHNDALWVSEIPAHLYRPPISAI
jgi:hypothetical protein